MEDGTIHTLDDSELPLVLPELDDYKGKNGQAPLENATDWKVYVKDGVKGKRETSTMPGSAGSSWYFMRYIDPENNEAIADKALLDHWLPVDLYIGGPEHCVGHLIYSRIWTKYLYQKGLLKTDEPFKKLVHQGMILGSNGIKMGKRFPEFVVNPSDIVEQYGADTLRLYEMFMGPLEASKPWSNQGVEGAYKFLNRVYRIIVEAGILTHDPVKELEKVYHQTVKKVTEDYEALSFNTAIAQMMIFINEVYKVNKLPYEYAEGFVKMISCIAPHMGEEMWNFLGHTESIAYEAWPTYDEAKTINQEITVVVQVNGKIRDKLQVAVDTPKEELEKLALASSKIQANLEGKTPKKIIVIPNKLVSIVC